MSSKPEVSVIIINYNGREYLPTCLSALEKLAFPKTKYEVIVVDNNSQDNSVVYIKKNFPEVTVIQSQENLGFARGNNVGVHHARGKYVVFLNTDTQVRPDWLAPLVKRAQSDPQIGAVNSKLLLYYPFVPLIIESDVHAKSSFVNSLEFHEVGVVIDEVVHSNFSLQSMIHYYDGFIAERKNGLLLQRWTTNKAVILIPVHPQKVEECSITIRTQKLHSHLRTKVKISLGNQVQYEQVLDDHQVEQYTLKLDAQQLQPELQYAVQNAGNIIFKTGHSRDRGAVVGNSQQLYELDNPFYAQVREISAFCGASALMRKSVFTKMGGFDESFFMYYEDVDLSLRLRLAGYKLIFEPKSQVAHIHAGSSGEWSPFFIYHVEKNHLAICVIYTSLSNIIREASHFSAMLALSAIKMWRWRITEHWSIYEDWKEKYSIRKQALQWVVRQLPYFIDRRRALASKYPQTWRSLYETFY
ncbi:MAG TPA: glycosyltransferase family 2 protein [Patescibacteria group bacterium]